MMRIPTPDLIEPATRALRTVLSGTDPLYPVPAGVIEAISGDVFGHAVVAEKLEPISYEEVARDITDPGFRRQLIGAAIALGMTVHPSDPKIATRTRELAAALDVDEPMLNAFERSLQGHRFWMMADLARHSWASDEIKRDIKESGVLNVVEQIPRVSGHGPEDAAMIEKFAALTGYPEGSWGKAVADFYAHYHWPLPGTGRLGAVPDHPSRLGARCRRVRGEPDRRAAGQRVHGGADAGRHGTLGALLGVEHLRDVHAEDPGVAWRGGDDGIGSGEPAPGRRRAAARSRERRRSAGPRPLRVRGTSARGDP